MTRFRILPYRQGSKGAKALAEALGGKVLLLQGSRYSTRPDDVVINWGNTGDAPSNTIGYWGGTRNNAGKIKNVSNKLNFFRMMRDKGYENVIPPFWTDVDEVPNDAFPVVCRTVLAGHSGDGIVIASDGDHLVPAQLFVKYIKKKEEFRVHLGLDWNAPRHLSESPPVSIITVQRKARRSDCPNPNWQVRNHQNGFVYVRNEVTPPSGVIAAARTAFLASELDFGAVDVIYNQARQRAYVLEINTAPGIEGQTIEDYADFFRGNA